MATYGDLVSDLKNAEARLDAAKERVKDLEKALSSEEAELRRIENEGRFKERASQLERIEGVKQELENAKEEVGISNQAIESIKAGMKNVSVKEKAKHFGAKGAAAVGGALVSKVSSIFSKKSSSSSSSSKGSSNPSSSSKSSSGRSSPSSNIGPVWVLLFALVDYFVHWYLDFNINLFTVGVDVLSLVVFYVALGRMSLALIPFLLQSVIPGLMIIIPGFAYLITGVISVFLIIPWFIIFGVLYEWKLHPESKTVKLAVAVCVLLTIALFAPSFITSVSSSDYVINQKLIYDTKDQIVNTIKTTYDSFATQGKIAWCTSYQQKSKAECNKLYGDVEKQFLDRLKIDASLNTGFTMDVPYNLFVSEGQPIFENKIVSYISAENGLAKEVALKFDCGLERKDGAGKPVPPTLPLAGGGLPLTQKSISCEINTEKKGTPIFYFNVTAQDVTATGYTDILITNKDAKEAVLSKYPGISENQILTLSKEFGFAIKSKESLLNPRVGKDDLVQPIVYTGIVTSFNAPATLLFGVKQGTELDFALFLKNNGNGIISSIKNIKIDLPDDMKFAEGQDNCGITAETYKTDWRKIKKDAILPIKSCKVVIKGTNYPNTAETRTLGITITYDYTITRKQTVSIA